MKNFWDNLLTKIGAFFGLIWVLIQIVNFFSNKEYSIHATLESNKFVMPKEIANLISWDNKDYIVDILSGAARRNKDSSLQLFADTLFKKSFFDEIRFSSDLAYATEIILTNNGNKSVNELTLNTNRKKVVYQYVNSEGSLVSGITENNIKLGTLLPNNKIEVYLWNSYDMTNNVNISFTEGVAKVSSPSKLYGTGAFVGFLFNDKIILVFIMIVLFLFYTSTYSLGKKAGFDRATELYEKLQKEKEEKIET